MRGGGGSDLRGREHVPKGRQRKSFNEMTLQPPPLLGLVVPDVPFIFSLCFGEKNWLSTLVVQAFNPPPLQKTFRGNF